MLAQTVAGRRRRARRHEDSCALVESVCSFDLRLMFEGAFDLLTEGLVHDGRQSCIAR